VVCHHQGASWIRLSYLTLSSPVMPFGIVLLIMFFICYNFWWAGKGSHFPGQKNCSIFEMERVNPFQLKQITAFFGMERVNTFQPKKMQHFLGWKRLTLSSPKKLQHFLAWEGLTLSSPKNAAFLGWKGLTLSSPKNCSILWDGQG
jgi:hypothetical protein